MAQPARRRRTQPSQQALPPAEPPEPPAEPTPPRPAAVPGEERVVCFLSGAQVPKSQAVLIRIGPNKTMWMDRALTNQG